MKHVLLQGVTDLIDIQRDSANLFIYQCRIGSGDNLEIYCFAGGQANRVWLLEI